MSETCTPRPLLDTPLSDTMTIGQGLTFVAVMIMIGYGIRFAILGWIASEDWRARRKRDRRRKRASR